MGGSLSGHSGWFKMPAATFLNRVPELPAGQLRIETGNSTAREFLMSGLHHPPPGRATGTSPPPLLSGAAAAPGISITPRSPQQPLSVSGSFGVERASADAARSSALCGSPEQGGARQLGTGSGTTQVATSRPVSPPGFRQLHGVFVPVDERMDAAVRTTLGISPTGDAPAVPPASVFLEAISGAQRPQPACAPAPFEFATSHRRVAAALPPERGLPRRHVPALGR